MFKVSRDYWIEGLKDWTLSPVNCHGPLFPSPVFIVESGMTNMYWCGHVVSWPYCMVNHIVPSWCRTLVPSSFVFLLLPQVMIKDNIRAFFIGFGSIVNDNFGEFRRKIGS